MAKVNIFSNFSELDSFKEFNRFVSAFIQQLVGQFNGSLDFVGNVRASGPHDLQFANGTTYLQISHTLGRTPNGIMPMYIGVTAATLYAAPGSSLVWTDSVIYLRASSGCTARIFII